MRWICLGVAGLLGCNATDLGVTDAGGAAQAVDAAARPAETREALIVDAGVPTAPKPSEADAGAADAGDSCPESNPHCDPCYYVSFEVESAWPGVHEALKSAAGRWFRWYVPGGVECPLRVLSTSERNIGSAGMRGDIVLNTGNVRILDSDTCEGKGLLLIDVLTHELGHVYGLGHDNGAGCALCQHDDCEPVVPTDSEIELANGCGSWGPPAGAECP